MKKVNQIFAGLFVTIILGACGGGGGGDSGTPPKIDPAQGVLSPTYLDFGKVSVGQTSGPRSAVLTNPGDLPLVISRVEAGSNAISNFKIEHNCPTTIVPGGSCTITFVCAPVQPNNGNVNGYIYHNGSYLGGDRNWHLQTYSYVTLICL